MNYSELSSNYQQGFHRRLDPQYVSVPLAAVWSFVTEYQPRCASGKSGKPPVISYADIKPGNDKWRCVASSRKS
jgi:hypothetical protein